MNPSREHASTESFYLFLLGEGQTSGPASRRARRPNEVRNGASSAALLHSLDPLAADNPPFEPPASPPPRPRRRARPGAS